MILLNCQCSLSLLYSNILIFHQKMLKDFLVIFLAAELYSARYDMQCDCGGFFFDKDLEKKCGEGDVIVRETYAGYNHS